MKRVTRAALAPVVAGIGLGWCAAGCGTGGPESANIEPSRATVRVNGTRRFEARLIEIGFSAAQWTVQGGERNGTITPVARLDGVPPLAADYVAPSRPGLYRVRCTVDPGSPDERVLVAEVRVRE